MGGGTLLLLLTSGGTSPSVLGFKEALVAALKADTSLSAIIGQRINPTKLRQTQAYPALTFQVVSRNWSSDLDGFAGTCDAQVKFVARSTLYGDTEAIVLAVRSLFRSELFPATLSGVKVNFTLPQDDDDDYADGSDASDDGTFTDSITILFSYVLA